MDRDYTHSGTSRPDSKEASLNKEQEFFRQPHYENLIQCRDPIWTVQISKLKHGWGRTSGSWGRLERRRTWLWSRPKISQEDSLSCCPYRQSYYEETIRTRLSRLISTLRVEKWHLISKKEEKEEKIFDFLRALEGNMLKPYYMLGMFTLKLF